MKLVHPSDERGRGDYGWLVTRYSFSFADWYDPGRLGFGALRVLNDDRIAPASGFGEHSHANMEIVTIVMKGSVTHRDSMGNAGSIPAGSIQTMSAGTGVTHSEYNDSEHEPLELFQLWIEPNVMNTPPSYAQKAFAFRELKEGIIQLVKPTGKEGIAIRQNAYITLIALPPGGSSDYQLHEASNGAYLFVVHGECAAEGETLASRDAIGIYGQEFFTLASPNGGTVLVIEVPMGR